MRTSKGNTYSTLLAVNIDSGYLGTGFNVPMELGSVDSCYIAAMATHLNDRITQEKKPAKTYEDCLHKIEHHGEQLVQAYVKLFETYQRDIAPPAPRTSSKDIARTEMLQVMDDKMLRTFAGMYLADKASDYILPDEREQLITATVVAMREQQV